MRFKQNGITLFECMIVILIIGLLVGGIIKGQSLIQNSRVHKVIKLESDVQLAFNGFMDRYKAPPGDYAMANVNLVCPTPCVNGNGNGRIETGTGEDTAVWSHLSGSNFLTQRFTYTGSPAVSTVENTLTNSFNGFVHIGYDPHYIGNPSNIQRHNLKFGYMVPSQVLMEVDTKIDDGNPSTGAVRFSTYPDADPTCVVGGNWNNGEVSLCNGTWLM